MNWSICCDALGTPMVIHRHGPWWLALDLEFCLARTTTAIVAEYQGHPVGVALGHINRKSVGRFPVNRHHKAACKAMLRLMRTAEGRRGARELMVLGVEGRADVRHRTTAGSYL